MHNKYIHVCRQSLRYTYLHQGLQLAFESEVDQVGLQTQAIVDGVNVSWQPFERPSFGHGSSIMAGCVHEDGTVCQPCCRFNFT